jgi:hypothetical protein
MRISCAFRLLDSRRTHSNCHRCGNNQLSAIGHSAQLASEFCHAGNQVSRKVPLTSRRGIAPIAVQFTICLLEADTPRFLGIIDSVPGRLADAGERTKHNGQRVVEPSSASAEKIQWLRWQSRASKESHFLPSSLPPLTGGRRSYHSSKWRRFSG